MCESRNHLLGWIYINNYIFIYINNNLYNLHIYFYITIYNIYTYIYK